MKSSGTLSSLKELLIRLCRLYIENAKLTLTEKLTLLLSAALLVIISLVFGVFALAFFAGAAIEALELVMVPWLSYLILGGVFVLLMFLTVCMRKTLIINPIARFISRLIFDVQPKDDPEN